MNTTAELRRRCTYTMAWLLLGLGACHKKEPDVNERNGTQPKTLVGVWRAPQASLDAAHSTCSACDKALATQGNLRFAINENGLPHVYGYSFKGQALKQGDNTLDATADCTGAGVRERVRIELVPAGGFTGALTREMGKSCETPYASQCACEYTLKSGEKLSDAGDAL